MSVRRQDMMQTLSADMQALVATGALTTKQALRIMEEAHVANAPPPCTATLNEIRLVLRHKNARAGASLKDFRGFAKIGGKELAATQHAKAETQHGVNSWVYKALCRDWPNDGPGPTLALKVAPSPRPAAARALPLSPSWGPAPPAAGAAPTRPSFAPQAQLNLHVGRAETASIARRFAIEDALLGDQQRLPWHAHIMPVLHTFVDDANKLPGWNLDPQVLPLLLACHPAGSLLRPWLPVSLPLPPALPMPPSPGALPPPPPLPPDRAVQERLRRDAILLLRPQALPSARRPPLPRPAPPPLRALPRCGAPHPAPPHRAPRHQGRQRDGRARRRSEGRGWGRAPRQAWRAERTVLDIRPRGLRGGHGLPGLRADRLQDAVPPLGTGHVPWGRRGFQGA